MKTKFLLPMLAMILAIGMSATEKVEIDATQDYILEGGQFMPLGTEIPCINQNDKCWVELENGQRYEVYDAPSPTSKKAGDGTVYQL